MSGVWILTSPRASDEPFAYFEHLAQQIDRESPTCERHVVVDAGEEVFAELVGNTGLEAPWQFHRYERPLGTFKGGNKLPYFHLLELARAQAPMDAIVLEDDVELCANAITRMLTFPIPADVAWVQFFSAWTFCDKKLAGGPDPRPWRPHPGLWRVPNLLQGCQAIKYPARTLVALDDWRRRDPEWQKYQESDVSIGLAQQRLGLRGACHSPDLVQHIGDVSVVSHGMLDEAGIVDEQLREFANNTLAARISATWPGRGFDAMRLFASHDFYR